MTAYLFIESEDLFGSAAVPLHFESAAGLARQGHAVSVFLVQNGVLPARRGARAEALEGARDAGVRILADDFSLRERGIGTSELAPGISPSPLESVIDSLAAGGKAIWH